jgi:hypothetical protein
VRRESGAELRVGGHRGMSDPVDRTKRVADTDGVQATPLTGSEHPRVDLQMQMTMRIPSTGREMPHRHRLDFLDRHLHLPAARTDTSRRMPREPGDYLHRGAFLRRLIRSRDVRVQLGRQRPRLRTVHDHLDKPHRPVVITEPAFCHPDVGINPGDPRLVTLTRQRRHPPDCSVR